jgi:oligopeptide/dipeptide ABC transporter ATP-binding protein
MTAIPLLDIRNLTVEFSTRRGVVRAVQQVDLTIAKGETVGIVGESGSGKSVSTLALMGLLPKTAKVTGSVKYRGTELVGMHAKQLNQIRGKSIAMIFQDPMTSLNPVHKVGAQIAEAVSAHTQGSRKDAWERAVHMLDLVGIPNARERASMYPHEYSGGMRQRAMIAMAMSNDPDIIIADEPTTALDVTIQAQILDVLLDVRERFEMSIMLITHDLGIVAGTADRVMVMYAGKKVEESTALELYDSPKHPYTWGLLGSTTRIDRPRSGRMPQIPGSPPSLLMPPPACRFAPRCPRVQDVCRNDYPDLRTVADAHVAACHFAQEPGWGPLPSEEIA